MAVTTFFWFESGAEQAGQRYVEIVPNSRVLNIARQADGSAFVVDLELDGQRVTLMNGGPGHPLTDAASIQLIVDTQDEVDRLWDALTEDGEPGPCGWLTDRFGLSWQVAPSALPQLMLDGNPAQTAAVGAALRTMSKIDVKALRDAYAQA
ncbi:VOC family protein [Nocardia goodfellowii]|uniref:3-demethylubiquinone-9 3-methyltransferase (Glyoxalase superfamily) n=1 Tax=Nocardia goodfellowii TaxID=882446 RepID=A0ABS4QCR9_9NOCA|nr:VOC family protein [Nocardia goodfellowii]MBP2189483.1 putative 3-demethylubiquinone-9 3-methyltransferase (glyoxalase superfamily) [Nocardia goodfellowii]